MRSLAVIASALVGLGLSVPAVAATGSGVTVVQSSDPAMTEGEVIIDGDPAEVFAAVADYQKWTEIMPDVAHVEVTGRTGDDARVTLVSPSGHRDNLHFRNRSDVHLIYFEDTGNGGRADVWADIVFVPTAQPAETRVHIRLYAKVHGIARLVATEGKVRAQREQKIAAELSHIRMYFQRTVATASAQ